MTTKNKTTVWKNLEKNADKIHEAFEKLGVSVEAEIGDYGRPQRLILGEGKNRVLVEYEYGVRVHVVAPNTIQKYRLKGTIAGGAVKIDELFDTSDDAFKRKQEIEDKSDGCDLDYNSETIEVTE